MISWKTSKFEALMINKIARRALKMAKEICDLDITLMDIDMDLTACHVNDIQLDLCKLDNAPDADFFHDVMGIRRHINRQTGKLGDFFVPRCALRIPKYSTDEGKLADREPEEAYL